VRLLVDTHALLWWLTDNPRLSYAAEAAISDPDNEVFVSACIGYEIAYKQRLGRLPALPESLARRLEREGIETLPVSLAHALAAAALPGPHRDPWDGAMSQADGRQRLRRLQSADCLVAERLARAVARREKISSCIAGTLASRRIGKVPARLIRDGLGSGEP
jgi:PIN domain nuclease of toxin-antitoxin system